MVVSVIDPEATRSAGIVAGSDVMESAYVHRQASNIQRDHGMHVGWEVLHGDPQEAIPQFVRSLPNAMLAMTTRGTRWVHQVAFASGDWLVFGAETRGLPGHVRTAIPTPQQLRLPMRAGQRSLNLSNAVAVTVFEAWRQNGFVGA